MTNIIDLSTKSALGEFDSPAEDDSRTYHELKMKNLVCLRLRELSIIGFTDKDIGYDLVAFATVSIKNPFVVTVSEGSVSLTPYFSFAPSVVATFSTTHIEAYIAQDKLPPEVIRQYEGRAQESALTEGL